MFIAHPYAGLVTTYVAKPLWSKRGYNENEKTFLYASGMITAAIPDLDLAYSILSDTTHHRQLITHTPFLYISISAFIFLFSFSIKHKKQKLVRSFALILFLTTFIHMLTDMLAGRMMLLYPFDKTFYSIFHINPLIPVNNDILAYLLTPILGGMEISFILSGICILIFKLRKNKLAFILSSALLATFTALSLLAIVILSMN